MKLGNIDMQSMAMAHTICKTADLKRKINKGRKQRGDNMFNNWVIC